MAGSSGTPLPKKLGIAARARVALVGAPADFSETLGLLPDGAVLRALPAGAASFEVGAGRFEVIVCFARSSAELARALPKLPARLTPAGGLWIAWPKKSAGKSSGVANDLTDTEVRAQGLATGLVDNKVCAIDATWSGLRFVHRLEDRKPKK